MRQSFREYIRKTRLTDPPLRLRYVITDSPVVHQPPLRIENGIGRPWISISRLSNRAGIQQIPGVLEFNDHFRLIMIRTRQAPYAVPVELESAL